MRKKIFAAICAALATVFMFTASACGESIENSLLPGRHKPNEDTAQDGGSSPDDDTPNDGNGGNTGEEMPGNGIPGGTTDGGEAPGTELPPSYYPDYVPKSEYNAKYRTYTTVGYAAEYLGTVARIKPETGDEGLNPEYPMYGTQLYAAGVDNNSTGKDAILAENALLCASDTTYDSMDSEGNLYLNGESIGKKLYKHTAAMGMYYGDVDDGEPALIKRISITPRPIGDHITGLYAPAGEVIKFEMSDADLAKTGGLIVYIGQALQDGAPNNIWKAREFNRMPVILNKMTLKSATAYAGSFLGGPIYVKPVNAGVPFTVTISGGVAYRHFILGYTSEEEFAESSKSSVPYFDLEVWDRGVRHSGPLKYADGLSYGELYNAARLWEKISSVSFAVPSGSNANSIIGFLYDPFIAAGAAVAFVGRSTCNCPPDWMTGSLDYDQFVYSGSWGNVHEFNHHHQVYGLPNGGEVTNNATSLISYALFTDISASRQVGGTMPGEGWNRFTNPQVPIKEAITNTAGGAADYALETYAILLNSFGPDLFMAAANYSGARACTVDSWFKALAETTHYDMSYYFKDFLNLTVSEGLLTAYKNYPMYVPVGSIYQTGSGYTLDGEEKFSETAKPYVIPVGCESFEIDLVNNLAIPDGFTVTFEDYTQPQNGTITQKSEGVYIYKPATTQNSGKIYVTLGIKKDDGAFTVENVKLALEFQQRATNSNVLDRTVFTYTADTLPSSIEEAVNSRYKGYSSVVNEPIGTGDNFNYNGNAQIWFPQNYTITEVKGRLKISTRGKYRISLRGRRFANLYLSYNGGKTYELAVKIDDENVPSGHGVAVQMGKYVDVELERGFIDFKMVLLNVAIGDAYMDLGLAKFNGESVGTPSIVTGAYNENYVPPVFESEDVYRRTYTRDDGVILPIDDDSVDYIGDWRRVSAYSTFGHIYEAGKDDEVQFTFNGTQFEIFSNAQDFGEYEVYIDGNSVGKSLAAGSGTFMSYLSGVLNSGTHTVRLVGLKEFNIDSIVIK